MSDAPTTLSDSLAVVLLLRIDVVCQRFEDAWQAASGGGPVPRVEEYLADSDGAIRRMLLRQLVLLDVAYRRRRGEQPSADEYHARFPAAATRLYAGTFAEEPRLAADQKKQPRYNAVCCAVPAAAGQGEDARGLSDEEVVMFRRWALAWLRVDLAEHVKLARGNAQASYRVLQWLQHWQHDSALASVRDKEALDKLPDDERRPWREFWDDVSALLARVGAKSP